MRSPPAKRLLSVQPVADGGGSEHALIRMIGALTADGWECHVALPETPRLADEYVRAGATLHTVSMARLTTSGGPGRWLGYLAGWPVSVARLTGLGRRIGATVIHSNSLHSWYGWAVAAILRRPHVWHGREIVFQSGAALGVERWLARHFACEVIAVSEAVAAQLDPANVVVITDEPDPDVFQPGRAGRFRARVGIADDVPLVGSVARIDTWKGFGVLLDAFPLVRQARPEVELVVAGPPVAGKESYEEELRRRAGSTSGVHWLGPRRDVPDLLADLDCFAQVSTEPEPFGLVVAEALASGVPVVAGAEGGPLEILGPAARSSPVPEGQLVPPGDARELAKAILTLLPRTPSTTALRQSRTPLRRAPTSAYAEVFDRVLARSR